MSYVSYPFLHKVNVFMTTSKRNIKDKINKLSINSSNVALSRHARERMSERNFTITDVLEIISEGIIIEDPTQRESGDLSYKIESPNFRGGRSAAAIVVIKKDEKIFVVTVMWID